MYQFLHTLMTLLDHCPAARLRSVDVPKWLGDHPTEMLFQLEGCEDLAVQDPSNLHIFQLKDHKDLAPAQFAEDVLLHFAGEYVQFKAASPEFVLYTSAPLDGEAFFQPFRALCSKLRETGGLLDVTSWSFNSDLSSNCISIRKAKVWASERSEDGQGRPIPRELRATDSVHEFLLWLGECLFIREAGIASTERLTDFLSRVSIDDGNAHGNLRHDVLLRLEDRLPIGKARQRLEHVIGKLAFWAVDKAGAWVGGHELLQELGIPQGKLSWGAVQAGCSERVLETHALDKAGEDPYEERAEALAYFRLWLESPEERPMFIVSSNGRTGKSRLLRKFAHYAAGRAPVVLVKSGQSHQGIVDELLRMAGWEVSVSDWTFEAVLNRLDEQPSRPDGYPSLIVLVDDFSGSEKHSDWVEYLRSVVTGSGGLLLLAAQRAALRMVPESTWQEWAPMVWRPPTSSKMLDDAPLAPSYELPYLAEQEDDSLSAVEKSVAGKCLRTPNEIKEALNHIASLACVSRSPIASVPSDQLTDLDIPCWDWGSANPLHLPQALVDAGLFRRSGEALVLVHCTPTVELVVRRILDMSFQEQRELSTSLSDMLSLFDPTVFQGFVNWLGGVSGAGVDDEGLLGLLRPWTIGHLHEWIPYVFEMVGDAALEPLRAIAEELVENMPAESDQRRFRELQFRVRGVLRRMKATGSPQLAQMVLAWSNQTGNAWLKRELLAFFSLESGEEGLDALLDQLRQLPGGGQQQ